MENYNHTKISWVQRLLWTVAGAEIPVLEQCPTDYKRFSTIGATILVTTLIAFCSGGTAAYYFSMEGADGTGSPLAFVVFGSLWAILIFTIDRSLVITLKKDPVRKRQKVWWPLFSRSILALVIAFMVSIPLELYIFRDFIVHQEAFYDNRADSLFANSTAETRKIEERIKELNLLRKELENNKDDKKANNEEIKIATENIDRYTKEYGRPKTQTYVSAKKEYDRINTEIKNIDKLFENSSFYSKEDSIELVDRRNKLSTDIGPYKKTVNDERIKHDKNIEQQIDNWETTKGILETTDIRLQNEIIERDSLIKMYNNEIRLLTNERDSLVDVFIEKTKNSNRFIKGFTVLEHAVYEKDEQGKLKNPSNLFFLWLIRLLFFIIEMLPTIVKIATKVGCYDHRIYRQEKELEYYFGSDQYKNYINQLHALRIADKLQAESDKIETEKAIRDTILQKIKLEQENVSSKYIDDWRDKELEKLDKFK